MSRCKEPDNTCQDFSGIEQGLKDVANAQLVLGKEALKLLSAVSGVLQGAGLPGMPRMTSCCDIPEPCWMPRSLGKVHCDLRPGDEGEVCLEIINCDFAPHDYTVEAVGANAGLVAVSKPRFTLSPQERACVTLTLTAPKDQQQDCCCEEVVLIWVRGCRNQYLNWGYHLTDRARRCCHRVCVEDCPDYVHHWYDHFYIQRSCFGSGPTHP